MLAIIWCISDDHIWPLNIWRDCYRKQYDITTPPQFDYTQTPNLHSLQWHSKINKNINENYFLLLSFSHMDLCFSHAFLVLLPQAIKLLWYSLPELYCMFFFLRSCRTNVYINTVLLQYIYFYLPFPQKKRRNFSFEMSFCTLYTLQPQRQNNKFRGRKRCLWVQITHRWELEVLHNFVALSRKAVLLKFWNFQMQTFTSIYSRTMVYQ